jgi:hypothetical protein
MSLVDEALTRLDYFDVALGDHNWRGARAQLAAIRSVLRDLRREVA